MENIYPEILENVLVEDAVGEEEVKEIIDLLTFSLICYL